MSCAVCGAETITAAAPSGREVALEFDHVWVAAEQAWPTHLYALGAMPVPGAPARALAFPVLRMDRRRDGEPSGPFRREHVCP
jgi:hypothetical protein